MVNDPTEARHEAVLTALTEAAVRDDRIVAAWLEGSRADGTSDPLSDIDLHVALIDETREEFDDLAFIGQAAPVVVHVRWPALVGVTCLLEGPVRLDLIVETASELEGRARPAARILVDKADISSRLSTGWEPDDEELGRRVEELVRMTYQGATWPVRLLRRGQWTTHAACELFLVHNVLVPLMLVRQDRRAFHRNQFTRERLLEDGPRRQVDGLAQDVVRSVAARSLSDAYRAHLRLTEVLGKAGRDACAAFDIEFPKDAEREIVRFYEREWPA